MPLLLHSATKIMEIFAMWALDINWNGLLVECNYIE
jgi:hypothetical protein